MPKTAYATVADVIGADSKAKIAKKKAKDLGLVISDQGGQAYKIPAKGEHTRLTRFLILGTEAGSFYASPQKLTEENAKAIRKLFDDDPTAVGEIVRVAKGGIAPKMDPILFALALATRSANKDTRTAAYAAVPDVCHTLSHLQSFVDFRFALGGFDKGKLVGQPIPNAKNNETYGGHASSAGLRRAIAAWFEGKSVSDLAYQTMKYKSRDGVSARDLLRMSRQTKTIDEARDAMYHYIAKGDVLVHRLPSDIVNRLLAAQLASGEVANAENVARNIHEYDLPREVIRTDLLNDVGVWTALLQNMPMTAMLRNLGTMASKGVFKDSQNLKLVIDRLHDTIRIKKAKVHPINVFTALSIYKRGSGLRGSNNWTVSSAILDALADCFDLSFVNVEPSGKNILLAIDTSGSMQSLCHEATQSSALDLCGVMATVMLRTEPNITVIGVDTQIRENLGLSGRQRVDDVVLRLAQFRGGGTNLVLPFHKVTSDTEAIMLFTDSENGHGDLRSAQENFVKGRPDRRMILAQMSANGYGWVHSRGKDDLDQVGRQSLEIVGFDPSIAKLTTDFLAERF